MHWIDCMPFYFPLFQADTYLPTPDSIFPSYTVRLAYMPYICFDIPSHRPVRIEELPSSFFFLIMIMLMIGSSYQPSQSM